MATIINKMIRVIPKKQSIQEVDCQAICTHLAETGGELWEKVIYFVNEAENCLDIKYKSRKGRGDLGIESQKADFDIWIIENYEGGFDNIFCLNAKEYELEVNDLMNIYCFDEIRFIGNQSKLVKDFYAHFFRYKNEKIPPFLKNALRYEANDTISFQQKGIYSAGTIYQVGKEFSRIPELVTKEKFFEPRMVYYWEARFLFSYGTTYGLNLIINSILTDQFTNFEWDRENLQEIQFCYKNRIVKKIETGTPWKFYNSEYFDNTVERNWIDYLALWKRGLI